MTALATRKLSPLAKRERLASARALSAPMTRIPMAGDPNLMAISTMCDGRAMLERRACQYAAWIAATERPELELARFNAAYDGAGRVTFFDFGRDGGNFAVDIPAHVLAFDAMAPALALPAPDAEPESTPRCDHTAPLALDAPAPLATPAQAAEIALPARMRPKLAKTARQARTRPAKAMREWAESRAIRAARVAKYSPAKRRAIGAHP